jgi:hypothetical protein
MLERTDYFPKYIICHKIWTMDNIQDKTGNDPHTYRVGYRHMPAIVHYFGITNPLAFSDGTL